MPTRNIFGHCHYYVVLVCVFSLACTPSDQREQPHTIYSLALPGVRIEQDTPRFLVHFGSLAFLNDLIFDSLVGHDEQLRVIPRLASFWEESADKKTWTIHLRPNVRFHNGTELTADDVRFTIMKAMEIPTPFSYSLQMIDTIDTIDRHVLVIKLKQPSASFLDSLGVEILSKGDIEHGLSTQRNLYPVGTGPYKVERWGDKQIMLVANQEYFLGKPSLPAILVQLYPSLEMAWSQLMAGTVDIFPYISPANGAHLLKVPTIRVYSTLKPYYYLLAFNLGSSFFREKTVRQALNYGIDKEQIVRTVLKGHGRVAQGVVYPYSWAYTAELPLYNYQPQKAAMLLKQAGWSDTDGDHILDRNEKRFEFSIDTNLGDDLKQQALLLIQQQLLDLGIIMHVRFFDTTDTDFLFEKRFDAHFPEIDAGGDPDLGYKVWHSSQIDHGFNFGSYRNAKVDQLLEEGRRTFDQADRKVIYGKFQREILEDPPGIFLFWVDRLVGINERIKGVKIRPDKPFANIHEWYVEDN